MRVSRGEPRKACVAAHHLRAFRVGCDRIDIVEAVGRLAAWDRSAPTGIPEGFDASDRNGVRAQPGSGEVNDSVAATIYAVWRNQIVNQTLGVTLSRNGLPPSSNASSGSFTRPICPRRMMPYQAPPCGNTRR